MDGSVEAGEGGGGVDLRPIWMLSRHAVWVTLLLVHLVAIYFMLAVPGTGLGPGEQPYGRQGGSSVGLGGAGCWQGPGQVDLAWAVSSGYHGSHAWAMSQPREGRWEHRHWGLSVAPVEQNPPGPRPLP